jgi:hypothetical protein
VQFFPDWPNEFHQTVFHGKVDIFIVNRGQKATIPVLLPDLLQSLDQLLRFLRGHNPSFGQHPGMGLRPRQVILYQSNIEGDAGIKGGDRRMQSRFKTLAPGLRGRGTHRGSFSKTL